MAVCDSHPEGGECNMNTAEARLQNRFSGRPELSARAIQYSPAGGIIIKSRLNKTARVLPLSADVAISTNVTFILAGKTVGVAIEHYHPELRGIPVGLSESDTARNVEESDELTTMDIFRAAQSAGAFDFLDDPRENIYSLEDGEPI